jgi:tetratricopeptide (TPR) repeat protein
MTIQFPLKFWLFLRNAAWLVALTVMAPAHAARKKQQISPWTGRYADFRALLDKADLKAAGKLAQEWRQKDLADVMALIALGEWYEKTGDTTQAARAYGSLIDYFPARADIRRWAAERLLSIKSSNWLVIDSLKKAVEQRPDHPSGHYLLLGSRAIHRSGGNPANGHGARIPTLCRIQTHFDRNISPYAHPFAAAATIRESISGPKLQLG